MSVVSNYSEEFKLQAVKKLFMPGSKSLSRTAKKLGISPSTLFYWKEKYSKDSIMKKSNKISIRSKEEKFNALIATAALSEHEMGEYLRSNGLHSSDLARFKDECIESLKAPGRPQLDPELVKLRNENGALSRDLQRKDKALAEMSARVILLKKSHEIWGAAEDDE